VFAALSTATRPLSQLAGVAVALVGIATIVGWSSLRSYLTGVGAPWVIWLVDPSHFVTQSLAPLTSLLFAVLWLLWVYVDAPHFDEQKRFKFSIKCALFGLLVLGVHFALNQWVFSSYRSHWNLVAYAAFTVAVIAFLTAAVKLVVELINTPRSTMRIFLIFTAVFLVHVVMAPIWESKGERDVRSSAFQFVELRDERCRWRLVRPVSRERVLLIDSTDSSVFRVAGVDELTEISARRRSECDSP